MPALAPIAGAVATPALDALSLGAAAPRRATGSAAPFGDFLSGRAGNASTESAPDRARHAAQEFVSIALVQPILSSLRESNQAAPPFAPGDVERKFGPLLDAEIARRIVTRTNFPIVDAVARRLLKTGGAPSGAAARTDLHA